MHELSAMLTGEATLSLSSVRAVAWTLLHFFWQGALVAAALAGALVLLRRRSAKVRYVAACVALFTMAVMPLVTAVVLWPAAETVEVATLAGEPGARPTAAVGISELAATPVPPASQTASAARLTVLEPALPWLVAAWLAGVVALSLIHAGGWMRVRRLRYQGTQPAEPQWRQACQRIARRLGIRRTVELLESRRRVATPDGGRLAQSGRAVSGEHLHGLESPAVGVDPRPRAGPRAPSRLSGERAASGGGDAAFLSSGRVVDVPPGAYPARALLRRHGGRGVRRPDGLRRSPGGSRGAALRHAGLRPRR